VADPIDRRAFLRRGARTLWGAAALGALGPSLLDACSGRSRSSSSASGAARSSSSSSPSSPAPAVAADYGTLDLQLAWVKDVQSAGEFIADSEGIYAHQGFSTVSLIAGGPGTPAQEQQVATGRAFIAVSSLDAAAAAVQKGLPITVIGAEQQKNPFAIMSPASKPLRTPQELVGRKVGVQAVNDAVWVAFLKANTIDPSQVTTVPVGFNPVPLTQGTVDAWFSSVTSEPIELERQGFETVTFLLNDFGYPKVGNVFIVATRSLKSQADRVMAVMKAEILGWKESLADPAKGAQLAATRYGQALDVSGQTLESRAQNQLIATGDALTDGLFYVSPAAQSANVRTLGLRGVTVTTDQLFDLSVLDALYRDAGLKAVTPTSLGG